MNVIKHMEAAFLFALGVAGVASVVVDTIPAAQAQPVEARVSAVNDSAIPVVHVTAKRLTPAEKQRLVSEEPRGSRT